MVEEEGESRMAGSQRETDSDTDTDTDIATRAEGGVEREKRYQGLLEERKS